MALESDAKFEEKLICCFKNDKNLTNFDPSIRKSQKICTLMGYFWRKYIMFELKIYRGVIFHDTEEWCKIWRKTNSWFGKWHEKFGKCSPDHSKVSKLELWLDPFIHSRKCLGLKFTEELCVMTMKDDAKFKEEFTCRFKINMRNLANFDLSNRKSQKCKIWRKRCKIWRKTDPRFGKWHEKFDKFSPGKSQSLNFDGILLTKVYNVWNKKVQRKSEECCKIWRKTDSWFGKWHEKFGKCSSDHSKVSKLELWRDPFIHSRKCLGLKFTKELCVMTLKNDAKFEEELTYRFTIYMRNLTNFDPSTWKSQKFAP